MGMGPRKKDNDVRSIIGKMVNPKGTSKVKKVEPGPANAQGAERQYKQTGKKYSGPNYKQKDPNVQKFGSK